MSETFIFLIILIHLNYLIRIQFKFTPYSFICLDSQFLKFVNSSTSNIYLRPKSHPKLWSQKMSNKNLTPSLLSVRVILVPSHTFQILSLMFDWTPFNTSEMYVWNTNQVGHSRPRMGVFSIPIFLIMNKIIRCWCNHDQAGRDGGQGVLWWSCCDKCAYVRDDSWALLIGLTLSSRNIHR